MTRIAAMSARLSNPGVTLVAASDQDTHAALREAGHPLPEEFDEWIVVETPAGSPAFRNRFVKTSLRSAIDGPFLYLDNDVLVRGDLGELFHLDVDLAGVANHALDPRAISRVDRHALESMGWEPRPDVYINGGVMFFNDSPATRRFCAEWHRRWLRSSSELSLHQDQPALNSTLYDLQPRLSILPTRFNAQFRATIGVIPGATIWHYYSSMKKPPDTRFELLTDELVRGSELETRTVLAMIRSTHPWRRATPLDDLAAARILAHGRFDGWAGRWLRRAIVPGVRRRLAKIVGR